MTIQEEQQRAAAQNEIEAADVANLLAGRVLEADWWGFKIGLSDGAGYRVKVERERYHVTCLWPQDSQHREHGPPEGERPAINVSRKRGVSGLVADITRRVQPIYTTQYNAALRLASKADKEHQEWQKLIDEMCCIMGRHPTDQALHTGRLSIHDHHINEVKIHEYRRVDFSLRSVPADKAKKLMKFIAEELGDD